MCNYGSLFIWEGNGLAPLGEILGDDKDIMITIIRKGEGAHEIPTNKFEWIMDEN